jgi:FlaA1/EpsC-like NDP-sugar epimerase
MNDKFTRAFDFAVMFFIISGSLYFLYYLLQFNKLIYLLFSLIIYLMSWLIRHYLIKEKNNNRFSELGMFFISMVFLAYSLYIFKIDQQIVNYLPDKLLLNSGAAFIFLIIMNLLPKRKSKSSSFLVILVFIILIVFKDRINSLFYANSWLSSLIIGTPYIYLLSILVGSPKSSTLLVNNS